MSNFNSLNGGLLIVYNKAFLRYKSLIIPVSSVVPKYLEEEA